jgi:hypothetical protein
VAALAEDAQARRLQRPPLPLAPAPSKFTSPKEERSYAIGVVLANDMKRNLEPRRASR